MLLQLKADAIRLELAVHEREFRQDPFYRPAVYLFIGI